MITSLSLDMKLIFHVVSYKKLLTTNQINTEASRNKAAANKSYFAELWNKYRVESQPDNPVLYKDTSLSLSLSLSLVFIFFFGQTKRGVATPLSTSLDPLVL
jgi:hypothetical protein